MFAEINICTTIKVCLHVPSPSPSPSKFSIVPMVMVRLMGRMGTEPILSIKESISMDTMINFDGDGDGHGDGDGTYKQALRLRLHAPFFRPFLLAEFLIFLTYFYVMCHFKTARKTLPVN